MLLFMVLQKKGETMAGAMRQICLFQLSNNMFCIDAKLVQEIINPLPITKIPMAPRHLLGLINIRGQIASCIDLRVLFNISTDSPASLFVVCRSVNGLFAFLVDEIGDVIEVSEDQKDNVPGVMSNNMKSFLSDMYRVDNQLCCEVNFEEIAKMLVASTEKGETASV